MGPRADMWCGEGPVVVVVLCGGVRNGSMWCEEILSVVQSPHRKVAAGRL